MTSPFRRHTPPRRSAAATAARAALGLAVAGTLALSAGGAALAQQREWVNPDLIYVQDEVERLKQELEALRGGGGFGVGGAGDAGRVLALEQEVRRLIGQVEQLQFQIRQMASSQAAISDQMRFRLEAIESRLGLASPPPPTQGFQQPGAFQQPGVAQQPGVPQPGAATYGGVQGGAGQAGFGQPGAPEAGDFYGQSGRLTPPTAATPGAPGGGVPAGAPAAGVGVGAGAAAGGERSVFAGAAQPSEIAGVEVPAEIAGGAAPTAPSSAEPGTLGTIRATDPSAVPQARPIYEGAGAPVAGGAGPREVYEDALDSLRAGEFDAAEGQFKSFVAAFPDNPRVGEAIYWLGETHYVRGQYDDAAKAFLEGFRDHPESQKAPDSLLKLGMSLAELGQREEACLTFGEVSARYPNAPPTVLRRSEVEAERAGCR